LDFLIEIKRYKRMISEIYRQIDVYDKKTEGLVKELNLEIFDLELMKSRFNILKDDPLMYNPYEIDISKADLFPGIIFDFGRYDYFLACYSGARRK
jgi:hypothetical protein